MDFPGFQFAPIASPPFTVYCQDKSGSAFFTPPQHVFRHIDNTTLSLLFSSLNSPISLRLSSGVTYPNPSTLFMALHWTCSSISTSLSYGRTQNRTQCSTCASPERRRGEGSPLSTCLLTILRLTQPAKLGAAFAASTRCCLRAYLVSTRIPGVFLAKAACQPLKRGLFLSGCRTWHFSVFRKILPAHFSRLTRPL